MPLTQNFIRLSLAAALIAGLGACTVVPVHPVGYRAAPPVYVESYPTYRYGYPSASVYYESGHRRYDNRGGSYYRDGHRNERHYREPQRGPSPLESAARTHRDVRRSLGLPRLPGMP